MALEDKILAEDRQYQRDATQKRRIRRKGSTQKDRAAERSRIISEKWPKCKQHRRNLTSQLRA